MKKPFECDEKLILHSEHADFDMPVICRGQMFDGSGRVMVYDPKGGAQIACKPEWLRRPGEDMPKVGG